MYKINEDVTYSHSDIKWKQKDGNVIFIDGRFFIHPTPRIGFSIEAKYFQSGNVFINSKEIKKSHSREFVLNPKVGYQMMDKSVTVNINIGYLITLVGTNTYKYNGLLLGVNFMRKFSENAG